MKLSEIGEFGFIKKIVADNLIYNSKNVCGIGDDCAVIAGKDGIDQIITTDMLIENTHFLIDKISAYDLGYKSLAVNLSDIAAMGGIPHSAFISIGIPKDTSIAWLEEFYDGLKYLAKDSGTMILGGDTTKSAAGLVINIAVIGYIEHNKIKYRSSAQRGDIICVTDFLGDSSAGLTLILDDIDSSGIDEQELLIAHNRPRPHLEEGCWLAEFDCVHAMMDVSDGIDSDLHRIMEQSKAGAEIELESIPVSESLVNIAEKLKWDIYKMSVSGGEDYCLLCTVKKNEYNELNEKFKKEFGHELYKIGRITESNLLEYRSNGELVSLTEKGYDHFKK